MSEDEARSAPATATAPAGETREGAPNADQGRPTFGWPAGSVRAILALSVAGSVYWLIANPALLDRGAVQGAMPAELMTALMLVLGYYFADRGRKSGVAGGGSVPGRGPLGLPRGSVRALLVLGFLAAVAGVWVQHQPDTVNAFLALPTAAVIVAIGSFLFGRLFRFVSARAFRSGPTPFANVIDDAKGVAAILAGAGVIALYCVPAVGDQIPPNAEQWFREVFPGVITFYFGTR